MYMLWLWFIYMSMARVYVLGYVMDYVYGYGYNLSLCYNTVSQCIDIETKIKHLLAIIHQNELQKIKFYIVPKIFIYKFFKFCFFD